MGFKSILILLLSIAWLFLCQRWYCCWMQEACATCIDEPKNLYPIGFTKDSSTPDTTFNFSEFISYVRKNRKRNHLLEISGKYNSNEISQLGIDRAISVASILKELFPSDSISKRSQQSYLDDFSKNVYLPMIDIQWVPLAELKVPEKLTILFPLKMANLDLSSGQTKALQCICKYAKENNRKINISGHSDPSGNEISNEKYSQLRAESIAKTVVQMGIGRDQVVIESFGSKRPIDFETHANNRRVEITIQN